MDPTDAEKAKADKAFRAQMILYLIMGIFIFTPLIIYWLRHRLVTGPRFEWTWPRPISKIFPSNGPVAQLIERLVRNEEVVGLIPIWSTNPLGAERRQIATAKPRVQRGEDGPSAEEQ